MPWGNVRSTLTASWKAHAPAQTFALENPVSILSGSTRTMIDQEAKQDFVDRISGNSFE